MLPKSEFKINDDVELISYDEIYNCYDDYRLFTESILGKELRPLTQDWQVGDIGFIEYIGIHETDKCLLYVLSMETGTLIVTKDAIRKINLYSRS
jgi:hypothetical protein